MNADDLRALSRLPDPPTIDFDDVISPEDIACAEFLPISTQRELLEVAAEMADALTWYAERRSESEQRLARKALLSLKLVTKP
jgi:hypothetical protein